MDNMAVSLQFSARPGGAARSIRVAWLALSVAVLGILVTPWLPGRDRVLALVPMCERKARLGVECPFCGMTTSFLDISEGRFPEANRVNRAGIPLYFGFVANEICAIVFVRRRRGTPCK